MCVKRSPIATDHIYGLDVLERRRGDCSGGGGRGPIPVLFSSPSSAGPRARRARPLVPVDGCSLDSSAFPSDRHASGAPPRGGRTLHGATGGGVGKRVRSAGVAVGARGRAGRTGARGSRVAEATERVRVVDAVAGRLQGPVVQRLTAGAAAVLADLAGYVREAGDTGGAVGRGRARVSPLARRRRGEKL